MLDTGCIRCHALNWGGHTLCYNCAHFLAGKDAHNGYATCWESMCDYAIAGTAPDGRMLCADHLRGPVQYVVIFSSMPAEYYPAAWRDIQRPDGDAGQFICLGEVIHPAYFEAMLQTDQAVECYTRL